MGLKEEREGERGKEGLEVGGVEDERKECFPLILSPPLLPFSPSLPLPSLPLSFCLSSVPSSPPSLSLSLFLPSFSLSILNPTPYTSRLPTRLSRLSNAEINTSSLSLSPSDMYTDK